MVRRRVPSVAVRSAWILVLAVSIAGCGGGRVRVAYEIRPPPLASSSPPSPSPPAPVPSPTPAATPRPDPVVPRPPSESRPGVPIRVDVPTDLPVEVMIRLEDEGGRAVAEDQASESGFGVREELVRVPPGRYRLTLSAEPLGTRIPLYQRVIELSHDYPPRFRFGLVTLKLPEEGSFVLWRGLRVSLVEDPSRRPLFEGTVEELAIRTTFGDRMKGTVVLPYGSYLLTILDPDPKDDAALFASDRSVIGKSDPIPLLVSESQPSLLFDLSVLVGLRSRPPAIGKRETGR